jgi:hypothetical protein
VTVTMRARCGPPLHRKCERKKKGMSKKVLWQIFSKVSGLVHSRYKGTIEGTFQNFRFVSQAPACGLMRGRCIPYAP